MPTLQVATRPCAGLVSCTGPRTLDWGLFKVERETRRTPIIFWVPEFKILRHTHNHTMRVSKLGPWPKLGPEASKVQDATGNAAGPQDARGLQESACDVRNVGGFRKFRP